MFKKIFDYLYFRIGRKIYAYPEYRKYMCDKMYLQHYWKDIMGYYMDFDNPTTYNEKLQWLKLYDRKPIYTKMVDKYLSKEWAANIIGQEYIIPTINVYKCFDDINFDELPNQFVLKCTHDSGSVVVCKDKQTFDKKKAQKVLEKGLNTDFYSIAREWPYKNVKPQIIAEEYKEDNTTKQLADYKFFCFDGKVKALFIATERQNESSETKFDFFDEKFNHLDFTNGHPMADITPNKPECFDTMVQLAELLSKNIAHVRVDFFQANGKVYFGEMTFYHWSGTMPFKPQNWDKIFGDWIKLPTQK